MCGYLLQQQQETSIPGKPLVAEKLGRGSWIRFIDGGVAVETCSMARNLGFSSHMTNCISLWIRQHISKSDYFIWVPPQNERLVILHGWFSIVSDFPIVIAS